MPMEITYLGHSSFKIRGKKVSLVTDPFSPTSVGFGFPQKIKADVVTVSHAHDDHNDLSQIKGEKVVIRGPGEYEVAGVMIFGISTFHDKEKGKKRGKNTVYQIKMDGICLLHCGDLGSKFTPEQIEMLNDINILFIPIGDIYTIGIKEAQQTIDELDPQIVIPMHYYQEGMNKQIFGKLSTVEGFLKEGGTEAERVDKLKITKEQLPEERKTVVLKRKEG